MKITKIDTLVVNARMRNWVLVKVETDQPGYMAGAKRRSNGRPRVSCGRGRRSVCAADRPGPAAHRALWQIMHRQYFWRGGITNMTAMSGIDQALWDIKGKELGKPVCELLGGPGSRHACGCTIIWAADRSKACTRPSIPRISPSESSKASSAVLRQ